MILNVVCDFGEGVKQFQLEMDETDTLLSLKQKVHEVEGVPPANQTVTLDEEYELVCLWFVPHVSHFVRELGDDDETLEDAGISHGSSVFIIAFGLDDEEEGGDEEPPCDYGGDEEDDSDDDYE